MQDRLSLSLYQPDIPQNVGAALRLCACLGVPLNIIEPCGFPWKEKEFRRTGMDYIDLAVCRKFSAWEKFLQNHTGRVILMTTKGAIPYTDFAFLPGDTLVAGRESVGAPDSVHESADARIFIPMAGQARSLNVINASAMIMGEALRQLRI